MDAQDKSFVLKKKKIVMIDVYEKLLNYKIQQMKETKDIRIADGLEEEIHDILDKMKKI